MKLLADTYKRAGAIHHGYAFEGEKTVVVPALLKFLEKDFGVGLKNNPDFSYQEFETFTIDDGRELQERHGRRAVGDDGKKIFIIYTRFVTSEAQNALLKIFEEPTEGTHFFLIMPNTQVLIPTLRSRLVVAGHAELDADGEENRAGDSEIKKLAKKFLEVGAAERIALVKTIVEEKDKGKAIDFVTALEEILAGQIKKAPKESAKILTEILLIKKYLHDRAPSVKLLLEHLCLFVTIKS